MKLPPNHGQALALVLCQLTHAACSIQGKVASPNIAPNFRKIENATSFVEKFAERNLTPQLVERFYDEGGAVNQLVLELMDTPADKWPELLAVVRCFNRGEVRRVEA